MQSQSVSSEGLVSKNQLLHPMKYVFCFVLLCIIVITVSTAVHSYNAITLPWRHNERDGVSNHRRLDCLLNLLFRHISKKTSKLRLTSLYRGIHRWPVVSPYKGTVIRKIFSFDDVIMTRILQGCFTDWGTFVRFRHCQGSNHYIDVIMTTMASQITSLTVVYSIVYPGADQRKHQSSPSLAFVRGIHPSIGM